MSAFDIASLEAALGSVEGVTLKRDELLSDNTTWRIGGPVALWIDLQPLLPNFDNAQEVIEILDAHDVPFTVVGGGSNILGADKGFDGVVIRLAGTAPRCIFTEHVVYVTADMVLSNLVRLSAQEGWSDFEFLAGIPGTVGGALAMNAGTGDHWIGTVVDGVTALVYRNHDAICPHAKHEHVRSRAEHRTGVYDLRGETLTWDYRTGSLRDSALIIAATLKLTERDEPEKIAARIAERLENRKAGQPLDMPSAGSVFRNPDGDNAWRLVDAVGLKGKAIGGAQISEMHTNFIVNRGGATASDVLSLIDEAQKRVFEEYGIRLQKEVRVLGSET